MKPWKTLRLLVLLLSLLVLWLTVGQAIVKAIGVAQVAPVNGWVGTVFQTYRHGNWEIYLSARPSGERRLTDHAAADTQPRLNIGGTKVVFVSERNGNAEIYTMNVDGSDQRRLTFDGAVDTSPYWSPDGKQILFVSFRTGNGDLYSMNADGTALRRITAAVALEGDPSWSPQGDQIIWVRYLPTEEDEPPKGMLWRANADGSDAHAMTGELLQPARPLWSPAGNKLAFNADWNGDGYMDLVVSNADGAAPVVLLPGSRTMLWWVGAWTTDSTALWITVLDFVPLPDGTVRLVRTFVEPHCLNGDSTCYGIPGDLQAMMPDHQALDLIAPTSTVDPLPLYSRLGETLVAWRGQEFGPSGLFGYDIQYRHANDQQWVMWLNGIDDSNPLPIVPNGEQGKATFDAPSTGRYYFRSRAGDNAGNLETWPTDETGDASTVVFQWLLSGRVSDNRNLPHAQADLPLQPSALDAAQTDNQGSFQVHIGSSGMYRLDGTIHVPMDRDQQRPYYQLPADNLLQDPGFEERNITTTWVTSGTVATTADEARVHSEEQALLIGRTCPGDCLKSSAIPEGDSLHDLALAAADDGTLHLFARLLPHTLIHQIRRADGQWLPYTPLANGVYGWEPSIVFDRNGTLHLAWSTAEFFANDFVTYMAHHPENGWSRPVTLGNGHRPKLAIDGTEQPHLLYLCSQGEHCAEQTLYYRQQNRSGNWLEPFAVATAKGITDYAIATVGQTRYISWASWLAFGVEEELLVRASNNGTTWQAPVLIEQGFPSTAGNKRYGSLQLLPDETQQLYLIWRQPMSEKIFAIRRSVGGQWQTPVQVSPVGSQIIYNGLRALLDRSGTIRILGFAGAQLHQWQQSQQQQNQQQQSQQQDKEAQEWLPLQSININTESLAVALDGADRLYLARSDAASGAVLKAVRSVEEAAVSQIMQPITISNELHLPTLALLHNLHVTGFEQPHDPVPSDAQSHFAVTIQDEIQTTVVYSTSTATGWRMAWVDMTPWLGQRVTVTVQVDESVGSSYLQATVDQVTVGSWRTPVPERVTPQQVDWGERTTLEIRGTNFIELPQILLDEYPLVNLALVDESTLTATVPDDLAPGLYDLWVVNPGGERQHLPAAVAIGEQIYLPVIE